MAIESRFISESAFEYLLREILQYEAPSASSSNEDKDSRQTPAQRLEVMGQEVGYRIAERISEKQRFLGFEDLDFVKFMCREFWDAVFGKKIDKLQTNHKGVFVLFDMEFKWIEKYTAGTPAAELDEATRAAVTQLLHFPCGIMRGALANLGMNALVTADFAALPSVTFNVRRKTQDLRIFS